MRPTLTVVLAFMLVATGFAQLGPGVDSGLALLQFNDNPFRLSAGGVVLAAPAGARVFPGGSNSSEGAFSCDLRLETSQPAVAIAANYSTQIVAAGWRQIGSGADGAVLAVTRFSRATTDDPLTAVLTVTRLNDARVDVAVRVVRHRPASTIRSSVPGGRQMQQGVEIKRPPAVAIPGEGALSGDAAELRRILLIDTVAAAGETPTIQAAPPSTFPSDLLPAGAKIGTAAVAKGRVTVVAVAAKSPMAFVSRHVRALSTGGWIENMGRGVGGFSTPRGTYADVCRGTETAQLRFSPRDSGGIYVRASVQDGLPCRPATVRPFRDVAEPILLHPPGVSMTASSGGGGLESRHYSTRLSTSESLTTVAANYLDQMAASAWPLEGRVVDAEMSVSRHRVTVASGEPVTAILSLLKIPGQPTIDGSFRLVRIAALPR